MILKITKLHHISKKYSKRLIASGLSCSMMITLLSGISISLPTEAQASKSSVENLITQATNSPVEIQKERTYNSTTYDLGGGRKQIELYEEDVRFFDEETKKLVDVDANLKTVDDKKTLLGDSLENYAYETRVDEEMNYLPKVLEEGTPVMVQNEEMGLTMSPAFAEDENYQSEPVQEKIKDLYGDTQKRITAVSYESDAKQGISFLYTPLNNGIKEEIILGQKPDTNRFVSVLSVKDGYLMADEPAEESEDKEKDPNREEEINTENTQVILPGMGISVYDKEGNKTGVIPASNIVDHAGNNYCEDTYYELKKIEKEEGEDEVNYYELTVVVPETYFQKENLSYPLTIDPSYNWIAGDASGRVMSDTYTRSGSYANSNYYSAASLIAGRMSDGTICRSFMHVHNLLSSLQGKYIESASLQLVQYNDCDSGVGIYAKRITTPSNWVQTQVTHNSQPSVDSTVYGSLNTTGTIGATVSMTVTNFVKGVVQGTFENNGIALVSASESTSSYKKHGRFVSADNTSGKPKLVVTYVEPPTQVTSLSAASHYLKPGGTTTLTWAGGSTSHLKEYQYRILRWNTTTNTEAGEVVAWKTLSKSSDNTYKVSMKNASGTNLSEGNYRIGVRGVDTQGNAGGVGYVTVAVDNTPPTIGSVTISDVATLYANQGPKVSWSGVTDNMALSTVSIILNGESIATNNGASGELAVGTSDFIREGNNTIAVKATDRAGNSTTSASQTYNVDKQLPEVSHAHVSPTTTRENPGDVLPTISYSVWDNRSGVKGQYSLDGVNYQELPATQGQITLASGELPKSGEYHIYIRAVDKQGNVSDIKMLEYYYQRSTANFGPGTIQVQESAKGSETGLFWEKITPVINSGETVKYEIYKQQGSSITPNATNKIGETTEASFNVTGNSPGTTYTYGVRSVKCANDVAIAYGSYVTVTSTTKQNFLTSNVVGERESAATIDASTGAGDFSVNGKDKNLLYQVDMSGFTSCEGVDTSIIYNSHETYTGVLGRNFRMAQERSLYVKRQGYDSNSEQADGAIIGVIQMDASGARNEYTKQAGDTEYTCAGKLDTRITVTTERVNNKDVVTGYVLRNGQEYEYYDASGVLVRTKSSEGVSYYYHYDSVSGRLQSVHSQQGLQVDYYYTAAGYVERIIPSKGGTLCPQSLHFSYTNDKLTEIAIHAGGTIKHCSFGYSGYMLTSITDFYGKTSSVNYSSGMVNAIQGADGSISRYTYASGRMEMEAADGAHTKGTTAVLYDGEGRVISEIDENGLATSYTYGTGWNKNQVVSTTEAVKYHSLNGAGELSVNHNGSLTQTTSYDAKGRVLTETDEEGNVTSYTYFDATTDLGRDYPELVHQIRTTPVGASSASRVETMSYNNKGILLTDSSTEEGHTTINTYIYDETYEGRVKEQTTTLDGKTTNHTVFTYDAFGNVSEEVSTSGLEESNTTSTYDLAGHVTHEENHKTGEKTDYQYNEEGLETQKKTYFEQDASDAKVSTTTYDASGRVASQTDEMGVTTTYTYDNQDRVILEEKRAGSLYQKKATTYSYEDGIGVYKIGGSRVIDDVLVTRQYYYDAANQRVLESATYEDSLGKTVRSYSGGCYTDTVYDAAGNAYVTAELGAGTDLSSAFLIVQVYNEKGNVTDVIKNPQVEGTTLKIGSNSIHTSSTYDAQGNMTSQTDGLGNQIHFAYDVSSGKLTGVTKADGSAGNTYTYQQQTGSQNEFTDTVTNPRGKQTKTVTNAAGQTLREIEQAGSNSITTQYEYDPDKTGNVTKVTHGTGYYVQNTYDSRNRLIKVERHNPGGSVESRTVNTYDNQDRMVSQKEYQMVSGTVTPIRTTLTSYDSFGRMASYTQVDDTESPTQAQIAANKVQYTYDECDRLQTETYPAGTGVTGVKYVYDATGKISKVQVAKAGSSTYQDLREYTYDARGRVATMTDTTDYLGAGTEKLLKTYTYDAFSRITYMNTKNQDSNTSLENISYTYNKNDQILSSTTRTTGANAKQEARNYTYNSLGQLSRVVKVNLQDYSQHTITDYTYDSAGNRTGVTEGSVQSSYTYNTLDQLTTSNEGGTVTNYTYDGAGNNITKTTGAVTIQNTYDAENRLIRVKQGNTLIQKNVYDGEGKRIRRTQGSDVQRYFYNNGVVSFVADGTGTVTNHYIYGDSSNPITMESKSGSTWQEYGYTKDIRGSITHLVNDTNSIITDYDYSDYGQTTISGNTSTGNELAYTGGVYDQVTGQYYLNARYYNPATGNFITMDSYKGDEGADKNVNLYGYCGGNPVNYVDPSGHAKVVLPFKRKKGTSYIFTIKSFRDESKLIKNAVDNAKIKVIYVDRFVKDWNKLKGKKIPFLIINSHASPFTLNTSKKTFLSKNTIDKMQTLDVNRLIILGCNAAHRAYKTNIATRMKKKVKGDCVASDGTVKPSDFFFLNKTFESLSDKTWDEYNESERKENDGWIKYKKDNKVKKMGRNKSIYQLMWG